MDRRRRLDRMSLGDLVVAYFAHYSIRVYLVLAVAAAALSAGLAPGWRQPAAAVAAMLLLYPLVEYAAHRWVLHGRFLYKHAWTARVWKRIHYDHHQDPHDILVLFGALHTTLPPILAVALPVGWLVGGASGALAALAAGLLAFAGYEFCHCVQHLPYTPANRWLRELKRRHLAHHFHNEQGNFGIISGAWDKAFGTLYEHARDRPRSETAHNLGYRDEERGRYPWVAALSATEEEYAARRARRAG